MPQPGPDFTPVYEDIVTKVSEEFAALATLDADARRAGRYARFRRLGV